MQKTPHFFDIFSYSVYTVAIVLKLHTPQGGGPMLALLKKDFETLTKQYKMHVILLVFFLFAGSVSTSDEFFSTFPMVVCSWFTSNIISWDERQEGTKEIAGKPYVMSKYLFQLVLVDLSMTVCVTGLANRYEVGSYDFNNVLLMMLAASLLVPTIMLPIIFKNSVAKSFLKYFAVLIIGVGMCYYFSAAFVARWIAPIGLGLVIGAAVLLLALYFASYKLSVKYYEKREL